MNKTRISSRLDRTAPANAAVGHEVSEPDENAADNGKVGESDHILCNI